MLSSKEVDGQQKCCPFFYSPERTVRALAVNLYIDASHAIGVVNDLAKKLAPGQANELLRLTLVDVGRKSKTIMSDHVVEDYVVPRGWVAGQIGHPKMRGLTVIIPVRGSRGGIGQIYPIAGYSGSGKKRRVRANIVRSGVSTLPVTMDHQGGNPPFIAKGKVFTRKTKSPRPIVRVVGLAVPQMPMNRSKVKIENSLLEEMEKSATRHFGRLFGG